MKYEDTISFVEAVRNESLKCRIIVDFDCVLAANMHRITLLARQYADNSLSTEDKARLEILNKRIESLIPSISEKEIAHVEKIIGQLHEIEQADSELRDILNAID